MRKFNPLPPDHPLVTDGEVCPICRQPFRTGDVTTLVATAPADEEEAQKARDGRPYTSVAAPIHWSCRTGGTVKIWTIAQLPEDLVQAWLQHLRDFDQTHPGCHFDVAADAPDLTLAEMIKAVQVEPGLTFTEIIERGRK